MPCKAGAEQGKKKNSIKLLLEHRNVSVFVAGLPVPADMRTFMRIKINLFWLILSTLSQVSLFLPVFSWSAWSHNNLRLVFRDSKNKPQSE